MKANRKLALLELLKYEFNKFETSLHSVYLNGKKKKGVNETGKIKVEEGKYNIFWSEKRKLLETENKWYC